MAFCGGEWISRNKYFGRFLPISRIPPGLDLNTFYEAKLGILHSWNELISTFQHFEDSFITNEE